MTKAESLAEFQEFIDDTSITSYYYLERALQFLNNFFSLDDVDTSKSTVVDQNYIEAPAGTVDVNNIWVYSTSAGEYQEMRKLADEDYDNIQMFEKKGVSRWYVIKEGKDVDKIYFTVTPTSAETVKIKRKKKFTFPADSGDSYDLPDELEELLILGAVRRYYIKILAKVITNREDFPDVDPSEIREIKKEVTAEYYSLLKKIRTARTYG